MSNFYTYFGFLYNEVAVSGYRNGKKFNEKIPYKPFLFVPHKDGDYQTVTGKKLRRMDFDSIASARDLTNRYKDVGNFNIFGLMNYPYVYIYENYKKIEFDPDLLRVGNLDIETDSENGYGDAQLANREIISITVKLHGSKRVDVIGLKPYQTKEKELLDAGWDIKYHQCSNERELLLTFITLWEKYAFDVITNWNGEMFDIPYIIKRIEQTLTEEHAKRLSPFRKIEKNKITMWGKEMDKYEIVGIPNLDYLACYKKFSFGNEESYKLEYIASKILGLGKLDYSEYGSLAKLYKENHNKFIDYNVIDVLRVEQLDNFCKFIPQIVMLAHFAKVNFVDTFGTIRTWDIMIHNYLMDQKIAIPSSGSNRKEKQIAGGFVKEPIPGKYPYVMTFDLTSLYPHLVMQYNISPETLLGSFDPIAGEFSVDKILRGEMKQYHSQLVEHNVTVSGKGTVFSKDKQGFLPKLMKDLFVQRSAYKKRMLEQEGLLQDIKNEMAKRGLK